MKGYSAFFKDPALLNLHHQIDKCHIKDIPSGWGLLLCREAVGVFCSASRLDNQHTRVGWKVHRLTKIYFLTWFPLIVHAFIPSVLQYFDPIGLKKSSAAVMITSLEILNQWSFQPRFEGFKSSSNIMKQKQFIVIFFCLTVFFFKLNDLMNAFLTKFKHTKHLANS